MSTKVKNPTPVGSTGANAAPTEHRTNPEVDAKIDAYIKENPKYWAYVQEMPRERLERSVVLSEVQKLDRQQKMRDGIMKRINSNPEMKAAFETLVKNVPEEQRESVMMQIATQARRSISRSQSPA